MSNSMFAPAACPLDNGRHEVYSVHTSTKGLGMYCRKCGEEWLLSETD